MYHGSARKSLTSNNQRVPGIAANRVSARIIFLKCNDSSRFSN